jgi:hypothetical protein
MGPFENDLGPEELVRWNCVLETLLKADHNL